MCQSSKPSMAEVWIPSDFCQISMKDFAFNLMTELGSFSIHKMFLRVPHHHRRKESRLLMKKWESICPSRKHLGRRCGLYSSIVTDQEPSGKGISGKSGEGGSWNFLTQGKMKLKSKMFGKRNWRTVPWVRTTERKERTGSFPTGLPIKTAWKQETMKSMTFSVSDLVANAEV